MTQTATNQSRITISRQTKAQLQRLGKIGDSYESVIVSLLQHSDTCDSFWSDRI